MKFHTFKNYLSILPPISGLDISDTSLKIIQLKQKGAYFALDLFGEHKIPSGIVEGGIIQKPDELSKILKKAFNGNAKSIPSRHVIVALPDENVFLKHIQIPKMLKSEIKNAILVEVERNIPIKIEQAYIDYTVLPLHSKSKHMDILLVVARQNIVDDYIKAIVGADLIPVSIEPEVAAISRSTIKNGKVEKPIIIVEIGANRTRLISFVKNSIILTLAAPFSASEVTSTIAQALNMDTKEAIKLRWNDNLLKNEKYGKKLKEGLQPLIKNLAAAIEQYVAFLKEKRGEGWDHSLEIDKIILSGGGSRIPGIKKILSIELKLPVEMVNPWVNVLPYPIKETPELSKEESVRFTTAIGLAISGVNKSIFESFIS